MTGSRSRYPSGPRDIQIAGPGLFAFDSGERGVRVALVRPPVVASVMACAKAPGVVVYAHFSELVSKAAGALTLDYGDPSAPCAAGAERRVKTTFSAPDATARAGVFAPHRRHQ